jgi:hypothetical protein
MAEREDANRVWISLGLRLAGCFLAGCSMQKGTHLADRRTSPIAKHSDTRIYMGLRYGI